MSDEVKLLPCYAIPVPKEAQDAWAEYDPPEFKHNSLLVRDAFYAGWLANTRVIEATRPPIGTDEVVERVARALSAVASRHGTLCEGEQPEDSWEAWEEEALAAIAAMKDAASD